MAFGFCLGVALVLSVWPSVKSDRIPDSVHHMECHDRFFMIAIDISFAGNEPGFEAVDETGVYPITEEYAGQCGYTVRIIPALRRLELRASYFSCHTDNKDDKFFTFNFNLIATHDGNEASYALSKTCSPALPWSPREVSCEANYMEVSVRSDVACPTGTRKDDWDVIVQTAYGMANPDWQVMFQKAGQEPSPMGLRKANALGYAFELTDGRLVFRTPYGQPDSFSTEVNGVPVEVVHATLFSRQSWVVLLVDLVATCSMHEGSYEESGYMTWETTDMLHPLVSCRHEAQFNIGANGELVEREVAEDRNYRVEKHNTTVHVSVPYNAEGTYRKSLFSDNLQELYTFDLYFEQVCMDEDELDTRTRYHRALTTPLLPRHVFVEERTVPEEQMFTVYLGDVPEDVELAAMSLNEHDCPELFTNTSIHTITEVVHPNNTRGYILKVPFDDPLLTQQFSKENAAMQLRLDIDYTLVVLPENQQFHHLASVMALTDASPPAFDATCSVSGISFSLEHRPFDYLWYITIGSELLTPELAAQHGYIMSNDSQSLQLHVPLFTHGYEYEDVTLKGFSGTFEILVRDHETSEVQSSTAKSCPFTASEFIMCSTDGKMIVAADVSVVVPSGGLVGKTHLRDPRCGPKGTDGTRALFSSPLNSCGSSVKLGKEYVTYENEIIFGRRFRAEKNPESSNVNRLVVRCTYPLAGLHRLFSVYKFESDEAGVGEIVRSTEFPEGLQSPTVKPTTALIPVPTRGISRPSHQRPVQFIKVSNFLKNLSKGGRRPSQAKLNAGII